LALLRPPPALAQPLRSADLLLRREHEARAADTTFYGVLHASPDEWAAAFAPRAARRASLPALLRGTRAPVAGALHVWARCLRQELRVYYFPEPLLDSDHAWLPRETAAISLVDVAQLEVTLDGKAMPAAVLGRAGARWGQAVRGQGGLISTRLERNTSVVALGVRGWLRELRFDVHRYCGAELSAAADAHITGIVRRAAASAPQLVVHTYLFDEPVAPVLDLLAFNAVWHAERYNSTHRVLVHSHQLSMLADHPGIAAAAAAGALEVEAKPDYLPLLPGWPMFWHAVVENVALLRAWGTHDALLFLDPDEFLLAPKPPGGRWPSHAVRHEVARHGAVVLARAVFSCPHCGDRGGDVRSAFATRLRDARVPEQYGKVGANSAAPHLVYVHFADPAPVALNTTLALVAHVRDALGRSLQLSADAEAAPPLSLLAEDSAWRSACSWLRPQAIS
jgi:hypothetical protein